MENLFEKFGGPAALARALGLQRTTVDSWLRRGGKIPSKHQESVLEAGKRLGLKIRLEDVVWPLGRGE